MLSRQQRTWFMKAINKLLKLDVSKDALLQFDSFEYNNDKNYIKAYIKSEDTGERVNWCFIYNKSNRIFISKPGVPPFHIATVKEDGTIDITESGQVYLKRMTNSDINNTMYNVISQILYMSITVDKMARIGDTDLRASYNATYPSLVDYCNSDVNNILLKIGDNIVPWSQVKTIDGIMLPLQDLDTFNADIVCKHGTSYIPFFKIWLQNGTVSFARYTLPQKKDSQPKLSNTVNSVPITDENILPEIKGIIFNYKKLDDIDTASTFKNVRCVVLSWKDFLEQHNIRPIREPDSKDTFKNMTYAWAIDDMPSIYKADGMHVTVKVERSSIDSYSVCIRYFATKLGNIINLHINPDPKLITDPTDLNRTVANSDGTDTVNDTPTHVNVFRVEAASTVMFEYNNGQGEMIPVYTDMSNVFDNINDLIILYNGIFDVVHAVRFNSNEVYGSSKTLFDPFSALANFILVIDKSIRPNATVFIHSITNNNVLRVKVSLPSDSQSLEFSVPVPKKDPVTGKKTTEWKTSSLNTTDTLFDQCTKYRGGEHKTLGAYLSFLIRNIFTKNVMSDKKGNFVNLSDNQQSKVNNASRLQFSSGIGNMLLNVRDAYLNTFGPFIGTHQRPSKFGSTYNIDEHYANTSKKETVEIDGKKVDKWIPVLASFSVSGGGAGSFEAMYNTRGEPEVRCNIDQRYKKVDLVKINDKYELSDDFLKWYLITCAESNTLIKPILRCIEEGYAEEAGISQRIVDIMENGFSDYDSKLDDNTEEGYDTDGIEAGNMLHDYKEYLRDIDEYNREMDDMYGVV